MSYRFPGTEADFKAAVEAARMSRTFDANAAAIEEDAQLRAAERAGEALLQAKLDDRLKEKVLDFAI